MYDCNITESYFPAVGGLDVTPITIGDILRASAEQHGDIEALIELTPEGENARRWTYQELLADSEKLARALASRHEKGARIAVWAPNMPEWVLLEFAAAMAGVVLVTVNPAYQARELKFVLEQSRSEAIYFVNEFRGNPMGEIARKVCDELSQVTHRILLDDHDALFAGDADLPAVAADDPVQIQYTSGTTGFPKGALLHHTGLVINASHTLDRTLVKPGSKLLHNMPMFHTTGCAIMVLGAISHGATIFLASIFEPVAIIRAILREEADFYFGVPTMIIAVIEEVERAGIEIKSIRHVMSGGAMVAPELVRKSEKFLGAPVQIAYGQTEASPVITTTWQDDAIEDLTQTIGQPLPNVDVSIRNPQTNDVMALDQQGEICCRGYLVMTGYNDNPEATAAAIDKEGWLHTGDLGRMDSRGYIKITGRVKEMIIRGGENLFPAEIENAMLEHEAIIEVAVVGMPDEKWGEEVVCFMRAASTERPEPAALKAFIRERLSPQKTPAYWIYLDEWPLTGSGKIQKFKLVEALKRGEHDMRRAD